MGKSKKWSMNNNITILLVPGLGGSGPDHWQSIWEQNIPGSRRVHFKDWDQPKISEWMRKFDETVSQIDGHIILIGHSAGALTIGQITLAEISRGHFWYLPRM